MLEVLGYGGDVRERRKGDVGVLEGQVFREGARGKGSRGRGVRQTGSWGWR